MKGYEVKEEPRFFDLLEYVDKIKLTDDVLYHLADVNESFEEYLKTLGKYTSYDDGSVLFYWMDNTQKELISSSKVEENIFVFSNEELLNGNLFFDSLAINQKRIKDIHKFVCEHSTTNDNTLVGEYRKNSVWVGNIYRDGTKDIIWWGPKAEDIDRFIKSYIEFYKKTSIKEIYSNPFLKAALAHLLFVRIHPFGDGNGRVSRIIQNLSFTSNINKVYGTKLKLSPLNISANININQYTYAKTIDNIEFDIEKYDNEAINKWLDFILNMYDEQLYFQMNRIPSLATSFEGLKEMLTTNKNGTFEEQTQKSKINKLF